MLGLVIDDCKTEEKIMSDADAAQACPYSNTYSNFALKYSSLKSTSTPLRPPCFKLEMRYLLSFKQPESLNASLTGQPKKSPPIHALFWGAWRFGVSAPKCFASERERA